MHYFTPAKTLPEGTIYLTDLTQHRRLRRLADRIRNPVKPKPPLRHRLHPDAAAGKR